MNGVRHFLLALQFFTRVPVTGPLAAWVGFSPLATVMLTGAFHEDGLADVADGLGGSARRDRALEIMKDSRIGASARWRWCWRWA
jgi:adenosylcobinamide-GDP ribazoletransferase